jgi:pimeloyl-ACP methyl ester carboxylesterase
LLLAPVVVAAGTRRDADDRIRPRPEPVLRHGTRFLAFIPHAQFRWLYGRSHVPISDDPELVVRLMLDFLNATAEGRVLRESLPAPA